MPTSPELEALGEKCDWIWTTTNGVGGFVVRGRGDFADASIFLPAAGWGTENKWWGQETSGTLWAGDPQLNGTSTDYSWSIAFRFHKGRNIFVMIIECASHNSRFLETSATVILSISFSFKRAKKASNIASSAVL